MSTATATASDETATAPHEDHAAHHPTDAQYVKIALILGIITAAEVGTYFWEDLFDKVPSTTTLILVLFPMMIAKFIIVAGWFMHLKYDHPIFRRVFTFGLLLATVVYFILFSAFEFLSDDYLKFLQR
jgi:cytochrome c oxidase subunit 4